MHVFTSLILTLLIFETLATTEKPVSDDLPSRAKRACCSSYSSFPSYSIKCGTIPCGSCCQRTPSLYPYGTIYKIPPLPPTIPPPLPPSPTAIAGCSVCG